MSGNLPMLMRQEEERAGTSLDNYHRQTQCTLDLCSPSLPQNNLQCIAILEILSHGEMHVVLVNMKWPQKGNSISCILDCVQCIREVK